MRERLLKVLLVSILIMTLTLANFITAGIGIVTYAAENSEAATNHENIEFVAYLKTEDGMMISSKEVDITSNDISLFMSISVKNQGYFNGEIELLDGNFTIKSEKLNDIINKIENNKISLNQINAGDTIELEVKIDPIKNDQLDLSVLNMESILKLTGIYRDSTEKDIKIESKKNVKLILEPNKDINTELTSEVLTNKVFEINGANKRVIQLLVESSITNNSYPIKSTTIEVSVPEEVESVDAFARNTYATNGKLQAEYKYIKEENKLIIETKNEEQDGKISWNKTDKDTFVVTYIFNENYNVLNKEINVKDIIELYNSKNTVLSAENKIVINEDKDGILTSTKISEETSIYKGKIYSGEDREYTTITKLHINNSNLINKITLNEQQSTYMLGKQELLTNSQYKQTIIDKEKMTNILGENAEIKILDGSQNVIHIINNNTEVDEQGNIVLSYAEGIKDIIIQTSKPDKNGTLEINNVKVIKNGEYSKEQLKQIINLKEKALVNYDDKETISIENTIELKETSTVASLKVNRDSLSTMADKQNTQIEVTLKNNNETQDLYKNPVIKIEFPSQVESININSIDLLYDEQLKIESSNVNGKTIEIKLQGEQTKYRNDEVIEGTTIIVNTDLTVNKKSASSDEKIKMIYINENAVSYNTGVQGIEEKEIKIVAPRGLVTINSVEGITAIGEEESKQVILEVGKEAKDLEVAIELINNNENEISNVKLLGNFPTKGTTQIKDEQKTNTINTKVSNEIQVSGIDQSKVKVFYSEKENPAENDESWTQEIQNPETVKSYLISIDNMAVGEAIQAKYGLHIPENLGYNEDAVSSYLVIYSNNIARSNQVIYATPISLTTGQGAKLSTQLKATVGGEDVSGKVVKSGEVIKYTATITNTGTETANNVLVTGLVPEGTVYIESNDELLKEDEFGMTYIESEGEYFKQIADKKNVEFTLNSIAINESKTVEYQVIVQNDVQDNTNITNKISVVYDEAKSESNEVTNTVEDGIIKVSIISVDNTSDTISSGYGYRYGIKVENISDKDIENVEVQIDLNEAMELGYIICENQDNVNIDEENKKCIIKSIKANSYELITAGVYVKQASNIESEETAIKVSASYKGTGYTSNEIKNDIQGVTAELKFESENENGYVNAGDIIEYKVTIKNTGNVDAKGLDLIDNFPTGLTLREIKKDGNVIQSSSEDKTDINFDLAQGQTTEIIIKGEVDSLYSKATKRLVNNVKLTLEGYTLAESDEIAHIVQPIKDDELAEDGEGENTNQGNNENESGNNENTSSNSKYMISGVAWLDSNENGEKDSEEQLLSGIEVKLLDVVTGNIAKYEDKEIITKTDDKGFYIFNNVPNGEYLVIFAYDTSKYIITKYQKEGIAESKNSNAVIKNITINGQQGTYGVSDTLKINNNNIANINIGLVETRKFDLELTKGVSKIIVQNNEGTKVYNYDNETIAKVEIGAKHLANTTVVIEYTFKVTNTGEVAGYIKNIVDYVPSELKFSSELNKDWYQSGKYLYNSSLANSKLEVGETKTITLTLTKTMTETNTGLINNTAEIADCYNESGFTDIDSTPLNNVKGEDDQGSADIIIGVRTGAMVMYIGLTLTILVIITIGGCFVYKRVRKNEFTDFNI